MEPTAEPPCPKRSVTDAQLDEPDPAPTSPPSQASKKPKKQARHTWPEAWKEQYQLFIADQRDTVRRRALWQTWPPELRQQVRYCVSPDVRRQFKEWEEAEAAAAAAATAANSNNNNSQPERRSHDWKEGARIGEASNPGPKGPPRLTGSRAPGEMPNSSRTATSRQRGVWVVPPNLAGESAKGIYPGPKSPVDHARGFHGGNGRVYQQPAAMKPSRPSRAGSAQRTTSVPPPSRPPSTPQNPVPHANAAKDIGGLLLRLQEQLDELRRLVNYENNREQQVHGQRHSRGSSRSSIPRHNRRSWSSGPRSPSPAPSWHLVERRRRRRGRHRGHRARRDGPQPPEQVCGSPGLVSRALQAWPAAGGRASRAEPLPKSGHPSLPPPIPPPSLSNPGLVSRAL